MFKEVKDFISECRQLGTEIRDLQVNLLHLQDSLNGVKQFVDDINSDVNKWQFKNNARLKRIQSLIDKLNR